MLVGLSLGALGGAVVAWRVGNVYLARGVAFGLLGVAGAAAGATLFGRVDPRATRLAFSVLLVAVASYTAVQSVPALLS